MKPEWLEIAKNLPCGGKVKVYCCGNSPSMLISHRENGYSTHCFRCNEPDSHDFVSHGQRSISEIQRHKAELAEYKGKPPRLPSDFDIKIPAQYAWFLKYGVSLGTAAHYGFGWSEFFHRIVLPIRRAGILAGVHLRAVDPNDKPKYLNMGTPEKDLLFWADNHAEDVHLIVTEDIISAIKVNLAGFHTVALNGSDITDVQAVRIADYATRNALKTLVWLDNDPAGHKGSRECLKQLAMQGINALRIESERDPKEYSREMIQAYIGDKIC